MKTKAFYNMRRVLAVAATGLALGGMLGTTSRAGIYQIGGLNAGGGVPAQSTITSILYTSTNCTLSWYGMQGWYTVQATTNILTGPWNSLATVAATDFAWQTTVTNPDQVNSYSFRLSQANSYVGQAACSGCHADKYNPWSQTAHASALSALTSIGMGNNPSCLLCHTVGYGQPTGYTNQTLTPNLANVGCEDCHGPAGWHKNSDHSLILPAVSLDPQICGSCHQGHNPQYNEYVTTNSFGLFTGLSHSHSSQSSSTGCAVCHSANNRMVMLYEYNDKLAGNSHPLALVTGSDATLWTATCATCHDPHSSNQVAQLRYPTYSTNWYTMPTTFDSRTVTTTNAGVVTTSTVNLNTVFDSVYNPNVQVCAQCHNTRGARWDGNAYGVITNAPLYTLATNLAYVDTYCTNVTTQVFTNSLGVPYLTNTYNDVYVCGRAAITNVTSVQTNPVYGVAVVTSLIAYTNAGVVYYSTNSSGYGRVQHYSPQYNILIGNVDFDYAAAGVPNKTHPHSSAPDQCVTCHVPQYTVNNTNVTGHTFALDLYGCLSTCHSSYTPDALYAKINNLQYIESNNIVRVASLLNQWALTEAPAILQTNYAQLAWEFTSPGVLGTPDSKHKVGPPSAYSSKFGTQPSGTNDNMQLQIPQDIRMARYDLYMAYNDQSIGVHNPTYVQALLDDAATRVSRQFAYANFSANNLAGFAPLTVKFSNLGTTGSITGYNWNFGDGVGAASTVNPTYVYNTPGIYSVTFTATTATGSETLVKTDCIRVLPAPTLSFVADNTNVTVGTTVNFTNTSVNASSVFRYTWYPRFGVSGAASYDTSGNQSVFSYTYTNAGTFSVELRATAPGGANGSYNRLQVTNNPYITVQ